jgi:hypothetical protein
VGNVKKNNTLNRRIGTYITQKVPGESYKAYIPSKLPPVPPVDLTQLYPCLEKATLALAELNSIHKTIPNTSLFVYMYVCKEALLSSQIDRTHREDAVVGKKDIPLRQIQLSEYLLCGKTVEGYVVTHELSHAMAFIQHAKKHASSISCPGEYDLLQEIMPGYIRLPYDAKNTSSLKTGFR